MIGCRFTPRESRLHLTKEKVEENAQMNMGIFSFNKFLHSLAGIHANSKCNGITNDSSQSETLFYRTMYESVLNANIGPMIARNSGTIFIGHVSCDESYYQSSLRTIQILSPLLAVKVPCMITADCDSTFDAKNIIIDFAQFMKKWKTVLYQHLMIEQTIQQEIQNYEAINFKNKNHMHMAISENEKRKMQLELNARKEVSGGIGEELISDIDSNAELTNDHLINTSISIDDNVSIQDLGIIFHIIFI